MKFYLNVQNKDKINKNFLDQNRPYAGIGYTLHDKIKNASRVLLSQSN